MKYFTFFIFLVYAEISFGQAGNLDNTFGTNGIALYTFGSNQDIAYCLALQPDGKIIEAGRLFTGSSSDFAAIRFKVNGTLDSTFGNHGFVITDFNSNWDECYAITLQSDGKIILAGTSGVQRVGIITYEMAMARYNANGTLDTTFGKSGKLTFNFDSSSFDDYIYSVLTQSDGKILIGGYANSGLNRGFVVIRLNSTGSFDSTFNGSGKMITNPNALNGGIMISLKSDDKIILAGSVGSNYNSDFALLQFNQNGSLDSTFGKNGTVITDFGTDYDGGSCLAIQPDGKILEAGASRDLDAIARYNSNGTLDSSFGNDGKMTVAVAGGYIIALAIQNDGKIIAGGGCQDQTKFSLLRFISNGTLDPSFGNGGEVITSVGGNSDWATSCVIQPDNKILLGGTSLINYVRDYAVVRYLSGLETGIVDFSKPNTSVFIYPNPIHSTEILQYTLTHDENVSICLYDLSGRLVQSFLTNQNRTAGDHSEQLNFNSSLPSGDYALMISNGKNFINIKIVKQ